jgi:hypothetical protein
MYNITLDLMTTRQGVRWAQDRITAEHYLHAPVDSRCRPLIYLAHHQATWGAAAAAGPRCIAILIFGRPEATRCYDGALTYGSQADVRAGRAQFDRWEVINLARVWVHRYFQKGGHYYHPDEGLPGYVDRRGVWRSTLASSLVEMALDRVRLDYLLHYPPCYLDEPYELRACLSYCDTRLHKGTIYRAAGFQRARVNDDGIETWYRPLRGLQGHERKQVEHIAEQSPRSRRYRSQRAAGAVQLTFI